MARIILANGFHIGKIVNTLEHQEADGAVGRSNQQERIDKGHVV